MRIYVSSLYRCIQYLLLAVILHMALISAHVIDQHTNYIHETKQQCRLNCVSSFAMYSILLPI